MTCDGSDQTIPKFSQAFRPSAGNLQSCADWFRSRELGTTVSMETGHETGHIVQTYRKRSQI